MNNTPKKIRKAPPTRKKKKEKKMPDFVKTMIATAIAGVLIITLMAVLMYQFLMGGKKETVQDKNPTDQIEENVVPPVVEKDMKKLDGMIQNINYSDGLVKVLDFETLETLELNLSKSTPIKDQYGKPIILKELDMGDIIYTKYNRLNMEPETFRLSSEAWEYDTDGITFVPDQKTIYRGAEDYVYTDNLLLIDRGGEFSMDSLTEEDQVIIKGYNNQLWSIELIKGHGFIELRNHSFFVDAVVSIDRDKSFVIGEQVQPIVVKEGKHTVVLEKPGYEDYIEEVFVLANETATIDLEEFQIKQGEVSFKSNRDDLQIYISKDEEILETLKVSDTITLDYGDYGIQVKDGDEVLIEDTLKVDDTFVVFTMNIADKKPVVSDRQVHISSETLGAKIFVNNKFVGYSPLSLVLQPGDYKVLFMMDGYSNSTYDIHVAESDKDLYFTFPALTKVNGTSEGTENGTPSSKPEPVITPIGNDKKEEPQDVNNDNSGNNTPGDDVYRP